jgi:predicted P-loop ATPase
MHSWTGLLKDSLIKNLDKDSGIKPILANLRLFLQHYEAWDGVLGFDEFANVVKIIKRPPWGDEAPGTQWSDHYTALTTVWFQEDQNINASLNNTGRAVDMAARANSFHPVREYLNGLVWDGKPRIKTWLPRYFHCEDTAYARAVGPRFLISAVARIFDPGCQVDHMLVFEGPQGKLKDRALRALAVRDEWYTDRLSNVSSKDAFGEVAGMFLIQISEMEAFVKASTSSKKAFLTRTFDRFRPPYGKHITNVKRQCVFAGTINPPIDGSGYLTDSTGNRRYWPIACVGMIDRDGIENDRDQLWAEAFVRFKAGDKWWLETPELEALAAVEQAKRLKRDDWHELIEEWIGAREDVSMCEVLQMLGVSRSRSAEMRIANIFGHLGFKKYRANRGGEREFRYRKVKENKGEVL